MAVSTYTLADMLDIICSSGKVPDPRHLPAGFGDALALNLGTQVMADLITERFNWKFNRQVAPPFYTNTWQQDYPQLAMPGGPIEWGDDCDIVDINNTTLPKPRNWNGAVTWKKQLTTTSVTRWRPSNIAWMYNADMIWGAWPGANTVIYPLLGVNAPAGQNPLLNFIDSNGNYLILKTFGTTGSTAPAAAPNAVEGTPLNDGSVVWVVVSGQSQGFRLDFPSNAAGPTYQIIPSYQLAPMKFTTLQQLLSPIPDSFSRHFRRGLEALCMQESPDPKMKQQGDESYAIWQKAMIDMISQANKEKDAYRMMPETSPVESRWNDVRPITADNPY